ncbi:MAG: uroporphyrinogen decarboxylase family protein [Lentisphaerota bacterium]
MNRNYYIDLASKGLRMPIGTDLALKEKADHAQRILNGRLLGEVIVETAARFNTPLAFPLMDLTVEKEWLVALLGIPKDNIKEWHFEKNPSPDDLAVVKQGLRENKYLTTRIQANCDAIKYVAGNSTFLPVGMSIGPFSMMTTLLSDPITAVYMAGAGATAQDDEEVGMAETALEMSIAIILKSIRMQLEHGAKAICVCEPAANKVYISPMQLESGSDIFDRYVINYNMQIRNLLAEYDADLIFHDCGELVDTMVSKYNELDPAILSLGSSRKIWEDAGLVNESTVLFGNLPTKKFYSDRDITKDQVRELTLMLLENMKKANHPFILGSECDVLSVPGATATIMEKIEAMLTVK